MSRYKEEPPLPRPGIIQRTYWYLHDLDNPYRTYGDPNPPVPAPNGRYNLVGSSLPNGNHAPCIDMDFPCRLIPSRTPGHFHLYIEREMTWEQYEAVLDAFYRAGLIERGFYKCAKDRKQTFLRLPGAAVPSCTGPMPTKSEIHELISLVLNITGERKGAAIGDEIDGKLDRMTRRVHEMITAKLDEIVARRVNRGLADAVRNLVSSAEVQAHSDSADGSTRSLDVRRLSKSRRGTRP